MDNLEQAMFIISTAYRKELPGKLKEIDLFRNTLIKNWTKPDEERLYRMCHNIAGSASTYGFHQFFVQARKIENFLQAAHEVNSLWLASLSTLVDELISLPIEHQTTQSLDPIVEDFLTLSNRPIAIIDDDVEFTNNLIKQLKIRGYQAYGCNPLDEAKVAIEAELPSAIIIDQSFPEGRLAGATFLQNLVQNSLRRIPIIFSSVSDDIKARHEAVRACSDAYLVKPYPFSELVETLDFLVAKNNTTPYKVVAIDDDASILHLIKHVLFKAGIVVETCKDASQTLDVLIKEQPDVLLLDMNMPVFDGLDIAAIVRQHNAFRDLPIVFLTGTQSEEVLLKARQNGVDDFLFKPIDPISVISTVINKAQRARSLVARLKKDGMTGLLTKTNFELELKNKSNILNKDSKSNFLCILDLDFFKNVNDKYGHTIGDNVISSFASLLSGRLRDTDIIGRVGGEEFAVILSRIDKDQALAIMDEIRNRFEQVQHRFHSETFNVTISIGMTSFEKGISASQLYQLADEALYQAKSNGRNRIEFLTPPKELKELE